MTFNHSATTRRTSQWGPGSYTTLLDATGFQLATMSVELVDALKLPVAQRPATLRAISKDAGAAAQNCAHEADNAELIMGDNKQLIEAIQNIRSKVDRAIRIEIRLRKGVMKGALPNESVILGGLLDAQGPMYAATKEARELATKLLRTGYDT